GDHGQDIIEVVRDAAGELAECFHFLGLADAVLRRDPVGEVANESVEYHAVAAAQPGDRKFDLDLLAVASQRLKFESASEDLAVSGAQEALQTGGVGVAQLLGNDQLAELASDRLVARPAEDGFGLR